MLPTELILMFISYLYKIRIIIINNTSEYENVIDMNSEQVNDVKNVYLGHLGESHYVPVDLLENKNENQKQLLYYNIGMMNFINWAKHMESFKIRNYLESLRNKQDESDSDYNEDSSSSYCEEFEYIETDENDSRNDNSMCVDYS